MLGLDASNVSHKRGQKAGRNATWSERKCGIDLRQLGTGRMKHIDLEVHAVHVTESS